jgi:cation transport ATPase
MKSDRHNPLQYETPATRLDRQRERQEPWRLAVRNTARVLLLMAPLAAFKLLRHGEHVTSTTWRTLVLLPVVIASLCFAHAYLGKVVGRKRADVIFSVALGAALIAGLYVLTRYMERL